ncbi:hypothetical protein [Thalassoglobus polymorphus]|uniref:Uncharacterized protein n=1 Tax=Thalassoglobus polymorphus TaxID=2527994 RepID=A0A517QHL1_9PLAN|nr:hypothetical protein [Thalassoglobus polymorphus]QDT31123.1 hypothetical protein Mal48_03540 [Thalassoglobus polymorphus]
MKNPTLIIAAILWLASPLFAQDAEPEKRPPVELSAAEQAFVDQLTDATLVGRFSIQGRKNMTPQAERYAITSVKKTGGNNWIVQARITYGKYDLPVPVPVQVEWAGDTPVLQVTDLKIPLMGEGFTARVMFYKDRYAGSWYHGKVGGHMWGEIEHEKAAKEAAPETVDQ